MRVPETQGGSRDSRGFRDCMGVPIVHGGSRRRRRDRLSGFRFFQVFRVPRPLFGNKPHEPRPFFGNNPMQCPPFFGNKPHAMPRARCRTLPRWGGRSRPASARPRRKPRLEAPPRRHESAGVFSLLVFSPSEPPRGARRVGGDTREVPAALAHRAVKRVTSGPCMGLRFRKPPRRGRRGRRGPDKTCHFGRGPSPACTEMEPAGRDASECSVHKKRA